MKKRSILALGLVAAMCAGLFAGCGGQQGGGQQGGGSDAPQPSTNGTIKIGYVNPSTGPLAGNGEGVEWIEQMMEGYINGNGGIAVDGTQKNIDIVVYDSKSDSTTCAEMAQKLVQEDNVDMLIAIQTPETVIPVAAVAERFGIPCVAIQGPVDAVAGAAAQYDWTFHAFWTIEKVYEQYKALWTAAGYAPGSGAKVGITFANDADGTAWYSVFANQIDKDGYVLVDPGQYPSGSNDFSNLVSKFKEEKIDILAGTNIPPDFSNIFTQLTAAGVQVGCITMGKCCLLDGDVASLGDNAVGIMSEVWWAPTYPYTSDILGMDCQALADSFAEFYGAGRNIPQPAGYGIAAIELAVNAFTKAGTTDKTAVRDALKATDMTTIVGPISYSNTMGGLTYSDTSIAGGQWQMVDGALKLVIIDNTVYPNIDVTGAYVPGNATQK